MQFSSLVLTLALAVLAAAQSPSDIPALVASLPSCAVDPLTKAIAAAGCGVLDYACQCGSGKSAILAQATGPIVAACPLSEALKVQTITEKICVAAGITSPTTPAAPAAPQVSAASSFASFSSFASYASSIPSSIPASFTTTRTVAPVPTVTANAASRAHAPGAMLGAAVMVAMAL